MKIKLLSFASAAEAIGRDEVEIELPDGSTLTELKQHLLAAYPTLEPLWDRLAVAVDGELAPGDATLSPASEVALLPPVSGGSGRELTGLTHDPIDVQKIAGELSTPDCGAVLLFFGNVRNHHDGKTVAALTYRAYETMAKRRLVQIAEELEAEAEALRVAIVHRLGRVAVGEPSVIIAAASPHREAAYAASRRALERLKTEVPIWKYEEYADGHATWREEEDLRRATFSLTPEASRPADS